MNTYLPNNCFVILVAVGILLVEITFGYFLTRLAQRPARLLAWLMLIASTSGVERLTAEEPAGVRMVAIVLALLYGMKAVVGVEAEAKLSPLRWLGFCLLWFGMRPALFVRAGGKTLSDAGVLVLKGLGRMIIGGCLVLGALLVWSRREDMGSEPARWLATPPLLIGLSLILHFGLFNVLAGCWRRLGADCRPLFRAPLLSTSLNEFWSKRWNLAFSEMTALAIYRPVSNVAGRRIALIGAFVISGFLHEIAISVPVLQGFGGPSLYFALHGVLVLIEVALERIGRPINACPWVGRVWTLTALVLPLPILFHRPFLAGVIWPIIGIE